MDNKFVASVSCIMSVYDGDKPHWIVEAIESVMAMSHSPQEFLIYVDGNVDEETLNILGRYEERYIETISVVFGAVRQGRAKARNVLVNLARYELIMLMDADDVCCPNRLWEQTLFLSNNPEVDVVGSWISEFCGDGEILNVRAVPADSSSINLMCRIVQPINHVTMLAKKSTIMAAGNYQTDLECEDYWLISKMVLSGVRISNLQTVLVNVRVSNNFALRRNGWKRALDEIRVSRMFYEEGNCGLLVLIVAILYRLTSRLTPKVLVRPLYSIQRAVLRVAFGS